MHYIDESTSQIKIRHKKTKKWRTLWMTGSAEQSLYIIVNNNYTDENQYTRSNNILDYRYRCRFNEKIVPSKRQKQKWFLETMEIDKQGSKLEYN